MNLILIGVFKASREPLNEIYSEDPNKAHPIFNIKENLTIMLVASSALSVCNETMDHSTGAEPKLCKVFVV